MRSYVVPGSKSSGKVGQGLSKDRPKRNRQRIERLKKTVPLFNFDRKGEYTFTPSAEQAEGLRHLANTPGYDWQLCWDNGSVTVVCRPKAKAYAEKEHKRKCIADVGFLEFEGSTAKFEHHADADLVLGIEALAKREGWTVVHEGQHAIVTRPPRKMAKIDAPAIPAIKVA
jgi:hypothetical protein